MKSDIAFQLENAAWSAFVVEAGGTIRHANQSAVNFFGPKLADRNESQIIAVGVAISSQPSPGTSVRIYLPASKKIVAETALFTADTGGKQPILMVADKNLLLTMGQTVLSSFGCKVITVNSGAKALDFIATSTSPIDLIITDRVMP